MNSSSGCLHLVVTAAPPVLRIRELLSALQAEGRTVAVVATPVAATWVDLDALADETGCPVRVETPLPGEQPSLPPAETVVAAPLTFNSLNKWASGFADNLALGVLNGIVGTGVPVLAAPCAKAPLRKHPAYGASVQRLTGLGVSVVDPEAVTTRAGDGSVTFAWSTITSALNELNAGERTEPKPR